MKRIISIACTFMLVVSAMAQTELELKKKELEAAEAQLKAAQTSVETLKKSIEKLMPIPAWKTGGFGALNFNQVGFSNWAAGGARCHFCYLFRKCLCQL
jgi:hypothetical protein